MCRFVWIGLPNDPLFDASGYLSVKSNQAEPHMSGDDRIWESAGSENFVTENHGHRRPVWMILKRGTRRAKATYIVVADKVVGRNATP